MIKVVVLVFAMYVWFWLVYRVEEQSVRRVIGVVVRKDNEDQGERYIVCTDSGRAMSLLTELVGAGRWSRAFAVAAVPSAVLVVSLGWSTQRSLVAYVLCSSVFSLLGMLLMRDTARKIFGSATLCVDGKGYVAEGAAFDPRCFAGALICPKEPKFVLHLLTDVGRQAFLELCNKSLFWWSGLGEIVDEDQEE